jgi:5-formyltetrahydrofolate cyclo-ligase
MNFSLQEFNNLTATYNGVILYKPLTGEIDYTKTFFSIDLHPNQIVLPANKNEDPFVWADKCIGHFKTDTPYILIPGTSFDIYGTRHGKGAGWYDRFLSKVPNTWLKIGITHASKLSLERLHRQTWDQTMDFVIANHKNFWDIYKTTTQKLRRNQANSRG